jgi:hypothetical protein
MCGQLRRAARSRKFEDAPILCAVPLRVQRPRASPPLLAQVTVTDPGHHEEEIVADSA